MKVSALALKNWCTESITPLAWQRIVIKCLNELRDHTGYNLAQLEEPDQNMKLEDKAYTIVNAALGDLYDLEIPEEITN